MDLDQKIYVAGHRGMVGSAIVRELVRVGYKNIITKTHAELDLTDQVSVKIFFEKERPHQVYLAAAKVGGIYANNTFPAEFIYQNLMIEANVIHQAFNAGIKKLLFLGSSCIYPKLAPQPMAEDVLLTGKLEPTNEPYAIAKIAGIKLCESYNRQYGKSHGIDYRSVMPTNLYGPGDNYHPENSHVIPALIRKFHEAEFKNEKKVVIWGSGRARREFLYVDDLANAVMFLNKMDSKIFNSICLSDMCGHINVGFGDDISIAELAHLVAKTCGYTGRIIFDQTKPEGAPRKLMDSSRIKESGWLPRVSLIEGIQKTYKAYLNGE